MTARNSVGSETPEHGAPPVESFLIQHIGANPRLRFRPIIQVCQTTCQVSRATATRHLSKLVRLGEVALLPDRTYILGGPSEPAARTIVEIRWYDAMVVIRPDGSSREVLEVETRVASGRLDRFEFALQNRPRRFFWWCTAPTRVTRLPARLSPNMIPVYRATLRTPLTAREAIWHRFRLLADYVGMYRMAIVRPARRINSRLRTTMMREREWVAIQSHGARYDRRLTPDAHLNLRVILPDGYPIGRVRFLVRLETDIERTDAREEARLVALTREEWGQDGLRRSGPVLTLSVPRPLPDRTYQLEWGLPTTAQRAQWLAAQRRRLSS